jgi:hypothetical protein
MIGSSKVRSTEGVAMTVQQLSYVKRWHVLHRRQRPVEFHAWDSVLVLWLLGWIGLPAGLILWQPDGVLACAMLLAVPNAYIALRRRLHRSGRLRCDWLEAAKK